MKQSKKLWLIVLIVALLFPLGSVCAQAAAKKPQVPITYPGDTDETIIRRAQWIEGAKKEGNTLTWWGILLPAEAGKELAEFNKVYPQIKVEYWRGEADEVASKIELQFTSKRGMNDVSLGAGEINHPRWRKMGMLEKFTDVIPGVAKWDKNFYGPEGDSAVPGSNATTPQYNTKLVSPAEVPTKWEDLLHPKWKGQLGMVTDARTWWTLALAEGSGWGVEKTLDYVKKLKAQKPQMQKGPPQGHALLIAGDFKIFTNNFLRHVILSQAKGASVDWCRVNPIILSGPNIIMPMYAPHPNAARLFLEWYLSPVGLKVHEQVTGFGQVNPASGSKLSEIVKGHTFAIRTEKVIVQAAEMDLDNKFSEIITGIR